MTALLRYNSHVVHSTHFKYSLMAFTALLTNSEKKPDAISSYFSLLSNPLALVNLVNH